MTKTELRETLRSRRAAFVAAMDGAEVHAHMMALADRVMREMGGARSLSAYLPLGTEIDPLPILEAAAAAGLATALPYVSSRAAPMRFLSWLPGDVLLAGPFGLLQPDPATADEIAPQLILTPLVGFDRMMARLGQGAGHYDRAFVALPHARRIGLAWSAQEADALPVDPWDVPLHAIATEREWITA
jgi:5-formyltetrahydrofolate cyclo-ligase